MIRHLFVAALRDLVRSPVQSLIAIGGLAVGLTAVILAGIVIRNQYTYDDFVPGHERLYYAALGRLPASGPDVQKISGFSLPPDGDWITYTPSDLAGYLQRYAGVAAVTRLGFPSAAAAIGQVLAYLPGTNEKRATRIIAVVPDFSLYPVTHAAAPAVYNGLQPGAVPGSLLHIRLQGNSIPETLAAIDRLWRQPGQSGPIDRFFLDDHMQQRYLAMLRQAQMIGVCAGLAILLACLGLAGIAVSTAERCTKEIGVCKTMGAGDAQIVALLLWQFAQPVLWANLIAWPVAWWLMRRWLSGFAYHIDLHWWVFAAASMSALLIALLTVAGQAFLTAQAKPVLALRYE